MDFWDKVTDLNELSRRAGDTYYPSLRDVVRRASNILKGLSIEQMGERYDAAEQMVFEYFQKDIQAEIDDARHAHWRALESGREVVPSSVLEHVDATHEWFRYTDFMRSSRDIKFVGSEMDVLLWLTGASSFFDCSKDVISEKRSSSKIGGRACELFAVWALQKVSDVADEMERDYARTKIDLATATTKAAYEDGMAESTCRYRLAASHAMEAMDAISHAEGLLVRESLERQTARLLTQLSDADKAAAERERRAVEQVMAEKEAELSAQRKERSREAAKERHKRDPRQQAKRKIYLRWNKWQDQPKMFEGATDFARKMLDEFADPAKLSPEERKLASQNKNYLLNSEKQICTWCTRWARGEDIPAE